MNLSSSAWTILILSFLVGHIFTAIAFSWAISSWSSSFLSVACKRGCSIPADILPLHAREKDKLSQPLGSFIHIICSVDSCERYDALCHLLLFHWPTTWPALPVPHLCSWYIVPEQVVYFKQQQNTHCNQKPSYLKWKDRIRRKAAYFIHQ